MGYVFSLFLMKYLLAKKKDGTNILSFGQLELQGGVWPATSWMPFGSFQDILLCAWNNKLMTGCLNLGWIIYFIKDLLTTLNYCVCVCALIFVLYAVHYLLSRCTSYRNLPLAVQYNFFLKYQYLFLSSCNNFITLLIQVLQLDFVWIVSLNSLIHGPGTTRWLSCIIFVR